MQMVNMRMRHLFVILDGCATASADALLRSSSLSSWGRLEVAPRGDSLPSSIGKSDMMAKGGCQGICMLNMLMEGDRDLFLGRVGQLADCGVKMRGAVGKGFATRGVRRGMGLSVKWRSFK